MVTNLPAEAKAKWAEVKVAKSKEEKIRLMQEFLSLVPKHKGTAKLIAHVKRRIAVLKQEIEEERRAAKRVGRYNPFAIKKEGAAQVLLVGVPNCGKSTLLAHLTNAKPKISPVPYTTKLPEVGMMDFEDVQFQLVEAPSFKRNLEDPWNARIISMARNADAIVAVIDVDRPIELQVKFVEDFLEAAKIVPRAEAPVVKIEKRPRGFGIQLVGRLKGASIVDLRRLLHSYRIMDALVKVKGEATLDDVEEALFSDPQYKPLILLFNRPCDLKTEYPSICFERGEEFKREFGKLLFKTLKLIRIYTKPVGRPPTPEPLILKEGATVADVARSIHKDFVKKFAYARVWSKKSTINPRRVGLDYPLNDGDIVEIRLKR